MSDDNKAPEIHIARQHQSAPKQHWADREMQKAAEEIVTGQFTPVLDPDDPLDVLSVGVQRGTLPAHPNDIDMNSLMQTDLLIQHPRVQEALARLEQEKEASQNTQEYLEKAQMLHELNTELESHNHWDGEGRWKGRENEEMRIGKIMSPFTFLERLQRVIGEGRIFLDGVAVLKRVALLAPDPTGGSLLYLPGQPKGRDDGLVRVATLQYPCGSEWMVMKFDEYGVPTSPKYLGWRTALLSLILNGIITEKQAHQAFPVGEDEASDWYRQQLSIFRNRHGVSS